MPKSKQYRVFVMRPGEKRNRIALRSSKPTSDTGAAIYLCLEAKKRHPDQHYVVENLKGDLRIFDTRLSVTMPSKEAS